MAEVTEVPEGLVLDGEFLDGLRRRRRSGSPLFRLGRVRRSSRCVYYAGTLVKAVQTLIVAGLGVPGPASHRS